MVCFLLLVLFVKLRTLLMLELGCLFSGGYTLCVHLCAFTTYAGTHRGVCSYVCMFHKCRYTLGGLCLQVWVV